MAQIYTEQQKADRTPIMPETRMLEYAGKQIESATEQVGKQIELQKDFNLKQKAWELQKAEDDKKNAYDLFELSLTKAYQNAYIKYPNNMAEYEKLKKELSKPILDSVPDSKEKTHIMAKVMISTSNDPWRIQKNIMDAKEQQRNAYIQDQTSIMLDSGRQGMGAMFSYKDKNLSPAQQNQASFVYNDAEMKLKRAYESRNAQDSSGNFIFNATQRAEIRDAYENRHKYALFNYVSQNAQRDPRGVATLRNDMVKNKDAVMKKYSLDEKEFAGVLRGVDSIMSGQATGEELQYRNKTKNVNAATVIDMFNPDGTVNSKYNNIEALTEFYNKLDESEKNGAYITKEERSKVASYKAKVSNAIINQIEEGVIVPDKKEFWKLGHKQNAGEVMVNAIDSAYKTFEGSTPFALLSEDEQKAMKAKMYIDALTEIKNSPKGLKLNANDPETIEMVKGYSIASYYNQIAGIIGYRPEITKEMSAEEKNRAYKEAYFKYSHQASLDYLNDLAGL